ncbi:hypothetical protein Bbelb_408660 [Branchiostoma belcheri]|nr:hypothetical protein Bbelb_408660 [Branchiostoma belcheri]
MAFEINETLGEDDVAPGYLLSDCIFDGSMTSSRTTIKTKRAQKHLACIIKADDEGSNRTPPLLLPLAEHLLKREDTLQDGVRFGELGAVTSDLPNTVSAACSGKANTATQSWAARERAWHLCTNTDVYCTEDRSIANQGLRTVPNGTFHYEEQVVKI